MRNSPLKAFANGDKKKKESEEKKRIRKIDEVIERGNAPDPRESKEMLKHYLDFIHDRKIV